MTNDTTSPTKEVHPDDNNNKLDDDDDDEEDHDDDVVGELPSSTKNALVVGELDRNFDFSFGGGDNDHDDQGDDDNDDGGNDYDDMSGALAHFSTGGGEVNDDEEYQQPQFSSSTTATGSTAAAAAVGSGSSLGGGIVSPSGKVHSSTTSGNEKRNNVMSPGASSVETTSTTGTGMSPSGGSVDVVSSFSQQSQPQPRQHPRQPRRASFGRYSKKGIPPQAVDDQQASGATMLLQKDNSSGFLEGNVSSTSVDIGTSHTQAHHQRTNTWGGSGVFGGAISSPTASSSTSTSNNAAAARRFSPSPIGGVVAGRRTTTAARRTSPSMSVPHHRNSGAVGMGSSPGGGGGVGSAAAAVARRLSPSQQFYGDGSVGSSSGGTGANAALKSIRAQGRSVLTSIIPGRAGRAGRSNLGGPGGPGSSGGDSNMMMSMMTQTSNAAGGGAGGVGGGGGDTTFEDYVHDQDAALGTLGSGQATDWESMAAAAAIVSGGVTATDSRNQRRYNVGDRVLVVGNVNKTQAAATTTTGTDPNCAAASATGDVERGVVPGGVDGGTGAASNDATNNTTDDIVAPVNKYGFPQGKGDTEEERRGPYVYVLSTVRKVHFEEDARYYTVTREDNGRDQRADTVCMEPVVNPRAEAAALKAAQQKALPANAQHHSKGFLDRSNRHKTFTERSTQSTYCKICCLCALCLDCIWIPLKLIITSCHSTVLPKCSRGITRCYVNTKYQSRLLLNGMKPYEIRIHLTMINLLVLCSLIFMFGDMFCLAFIPPHLDFANHILFLVVWIILVLELIFEVMIRPAGYQALTQSEKAYAPSTARFLNRFHLIFEVLALMLFLPELWCLFDPTNDSPYRCSEAVAMNMIESSLKSVLGPFRLDSFAGLCMFAFARLRIFGVVRHWKRMWINASLTPASAGKHHHSHNQHSRRWHTCRGFLVPPKCTDSEQTLKETHMSQYEENEALLSLKNKKHKNSNTNATTSTTKKRDDSTAATENMDDDDDDDGDGGGGSGGSAGVNMKNAPKPPSKEEDLRLKNAATIGTALLVINSHRAMLLLVAIVALLPIINTIRIDGGANNSAYQMVQLLQQNNVIASSSNESDCLYLENASNSWLRSTAFVQRDQSTAEPELRLLWAQLLPVRCPFQGSSGIITSESCANALASGDGRLERDRQLQQVCNVWGYGIANESQQSIESGNPSSFVQSLDIREGAIARHESWKAIINGETYEVSALFNESRTVRAVNVSSFLLQLSLLILILIGLSVLRVDAGRLVLNPLRRMLKIVLRYAENPLAPAPRQRLKSAAASGAGGADGTGGGQGAEGGAGGGGGGNDDNGGDGTLGGGGTGGGVGSSNVGGGGGADRSTNADRNSGAGTSGMEGDQDFFDDSLSDDDDDNDEDQLGHYETEQLINAITKITDLLRKCWGVAGAGIISSNLARTEGGKTAVFNPCVPGRLVYALFGFVGINDFSQHLRNLDQDVMILINDVARVVHGEVYRWGYGDTGQCNKNLGSCFLMVFRIGDSQTVQKRKEMATQVIFSSMRKRSSATTSTSSSVIRHRLRSGKAGLRGSGGGTEAANQQNKAVNRRKKIAQRRRKMSDLMSDNLQLASLPGISSFTDRAVIGFLKSYAGVYRDKHIQNWKDDFRLGAGVRAFSVDMIFGMDAGWAVEGAVGSEYKIDATYLSPHVNMASRMMSASKQYGVSLLVSQAVEELLSDKARSKFRHLDTVTVKGSSVRQRIFTYDMRHSGVDFFLFDRSDKDADLDAECYSPSIWDTDQDLIRMRQHISSDFLREFNFGRDQYLAGNWDAALEHLKKADTIMVTHVVDEGYLEESVEGIDHLLVSGDESNADVCRLRAEIRDGPSQCLIAYMEKRNGVAPKGWAGYRPLTSK